MSDLFKIIAWAKELLLTTSDTKSFRKALDAFEDELPDSMKTNRELMQSWIPALVHAYAVCEYSNVRPRIGGIFLNYMKPLRLMTAVKRELRPYYCAAKTDPDHARLKLYLSRQKMLRQINLFL